MSPRDAHRRDVMRCTLTTHEERTRKRARVERDGRRGDVRSDATGIIDIFFDAPRQTYPLPTFFSTI